MCCFPLEQSLIKVSKILFRLRKSLMQCFQSYELECLVGSYLQFTYPQRLKKERHYLNSKMSSIAIFTIICMCYVTVWAPKIHYVSIIQTVTNYDSCLNDSTVCDGHTRCLGQQVQLSFEMILVFCTEVRCLHKRQRTEPYSTQPNVTVIGKSLVGCWRQTCVLPDYVLI